MPVNIQYHCKLLFLPLQERRHEVKFRFLDTINLALRVLSDPVAPSQLEDFSSKYGATVTGSPP